MANPILNCLAQFRERLVVPFGHKDWIVSKTSYALLCFGDRSIDHTAKQMLFAIFDKCNNGAEAGGAVIKAASLTRIASKIYAWFVV